MVVSGGVPWVVHEENPPKEPKPEAALTHTAGRPWSLSFRCGRPASHDALGLLGSARCQMPLPHSPCLSPGLCRSPGGAGPRASCSQRWFLGRKLALKPGMDAGGCLAGWSSAPAGEPQGAPPLTGRAGGAVGAGVPSPRVSLRCRLPPLLWEDVEEHSKARGTAPQAAVQDRPE